MTSDSQIKPANKRPFLRRLTSLVTSGKGGGGQQHNQQPETGTDVTPSSEHQRQVDVIIYKQRRLEEMTGYVQATREILRDLRADFEALQVSSWSVSLHLSPASTAAVIETAIDRLEDYEQNQHGDRRLSSLVARRLSTLPHAYSSLRAHYDTKSSGELDSEIKRVQERTELLRRQLMSQRRALHILRLEYNDAKSWLAAFKYVIYRDMIAECLRVLDLNDDDGHVTSRRGSFQPQQQRGPGNSNKKKNTHSSGRRTM